MCGYLGKISKNQFSTISFEEANRNIICRGPDSIKRIEGQFKDLPGINIQDFFCLIFNRLSIIDLSEDAMQPMISENYRTMILFNGEIYNHNELRSELEKQGVSFKTSHSDTEVLLNGISHQGISFINKIIGQFSIIFFDSKNQELYLIRDRVGQKPLYYTNSEKELTFSSNLKSIVKLENNSQLNETSLVKYLTFGVVPSPETLFKNIYKVEPGSYLKVDLSKDKYTYSTSKYWQIENFIDNARFDKEEFFEIFFKSVSSRLESDVPVANLLSGGIDSTSILKAMHDFGNENINTFSVANKESKYDESYWSDLAAKKYSTTHNKSVISSKISNEDIFASIDIFDEPYADPSSVPSYILSKEISKSYKVAISGDGGDELLGGYNRLSNTLSKKHGFMNPISNLFNIYPGFLGTGNRLLKKSNDLEISYPSYFEDTKILKMLNLKSISRFKDDYMIRTGDDYKRLLTADYKFYLAEMMNHKVDRTSMANSLEIRSPFLDHRLIEYIMSRENSYFDINSSKKILKNYLSADFEDNFTSRNKQGFVFNLEGWVYKNIDIISETLKNGDYVVHLNKNILSQLSINKSRINGLRIWKLFFLERYLKNILN